MNAHAAIDRDGEAWHEFGQRLLDPWWRLTSGALYKIMVKEDEADEDGLVQPFVPNAEQQGLLKRLHNRMVILKARQVGSTTLFSIYQTDHALFNENQRCGIIAHNQEAAETIFRDKVKFAYLNLPEPLRLQMPLLRDAADELLLAHNNSSVRVAVSMRSSTLNRLLVTEYGKTAAQYPQRAVEVETGSLRAVPRGAVAIVESTAEGRKGQFFDLVQKAIASAETAKAERRRLQPNEWALQFIGWWQHAKYAIDPTGVAISPKQHEYFDDIGREMRTAISLRQRAWYVAEMSSFTGDTDDRQAKMWQEFPSTPKEAFQKSSDQFYFAKQVLRARAEQRIRAIPFVQHVPVNTFWDIGSRDGTGVWVHQHIHPNHRFLRYIEGWGEPYDTFIKQLAAMPVLWGKHYLPHDAMAERQDAYRIWTPMEVLQGMQPTWRFEIVPRVEEKQHAVSAVRTVFAECLFDEEGCKEGIEHLESYSKRWSPQTQTWADEPLKDIHTEGADSFMQFAQAYESLNVNPQNTPNRKGARRRMS